MMRRASSEKKKNVLFLSLIVTAQWNRAAEGAAEIVPAIGRLLGVAVGVVGAVQGVCGFCRSTRVTLLALLAQLLAFSALLRKNSYNVP